jgi:hypothetical protein
MSINDLRLYLTEGAYEPHPQSLRNEFYGQTRGELIKRILEDEYVEEEFGSL